MVRLSGAMQQCCCACGRGRCPVVDSPTLTLHTIMLGQAEASGSSFKITKPHNSTAGTYQVTS